MKRLIIVILILAVIGVAFYYGYRHAMIKTVKLTSVVLGQSITLKYRPAAKPDNSYYQVFFDTTRKVFIFNGRGNLHTIMLCAQHTDGEDMRFRHKDNPTIDNQYYAFSLSYPSEDADINILNLLGRQIGFTCELYSITTEAKYYAKTKNLINISPLPSGKYERSISQDGSVYKYRNANVSDILGQFRHKHKYDVTMIYVPKTENGIFNVDINMPPSIEEAISEIRQKTGIEIGTPITVKTYNLIFNQN
jgi:hypothetical protein